MRQKILLIGAGLSTQQLVPYLKRRIASHQWIIGDMQSKWSRIDIFSEMCIYFDIRPVKFYSSLSNVYKEDLIQELDRKTGILEKKNIKKLF